MRPINRIASHMRPEAEHIGSTGRWIEQEPSGYHRQVYTLNLWSTFARYKERRLKMYLVGVKESIPTAWPAEFAVRVAQHTKHHVSQTQRASTKYGTAAQ